MNHPEDTVLLRFWLSSSTGRRAAFLSGSPHNARGCGSGLRPHSFESWKAKQESESILTYVHHRIQYIQLLMNTLDNSKVIIPEEADPSLSVQIRSWEAEMGRNCPRLEEAERQDTECRQDPGSGNLNRYWWAQASLFPVWSAHQCPGFNLGALLFGCWLWGRWRVWENSELFYSIREV